MDNPHVGPRSRFTNPTLGLPVYAGNVALGFELAVAHDITGF